jgi:transposase
LIEWTLPCVSIGIMLPGPPFCREKEESVGEHTVVAVDVAKTVFELAVSEEAGRVRLHRRLSRRELQVFFTQARESTVVIEACGSAHFWARQLQALGHAVVLLPPHQVRPYVMRNKTDRADAKGILKAYRNSELRPVPVKTVSQQVLGSIHRSRAGWISARTAHVNTLRGLLRELGFVIPEGIEKVLPQVRQLIAKAESGLPGSLRWTVAAACDEIESLGERIRQAECQLEALAEQTPVVERLRSIPAIGLMTSTALVAFVGDARRFPSGRHFASYLALTPRLPAIAPRARRALGSLPREESDLPRSAPNLGPQAPEPDPSQQSRGGPCKQARPDRLGCVAQRSGLRISRARRLEEIAHPGLCGDRRDGETGRTGEREAQNKDGPRGRFHRLAPARADSIMARG